MIAPPSESPETYWTGVHLSVGDVASKFSANEVIESKAFTCEREPHPTNFKMVLEFGVEEEGWLSAWVMTTTKDVNFRRIKLVIVDEKGAKVKTIDNKRIYPSGIGTYRNLYGWRKFYKPTDTSTISKIWRISLEIEYEASPTVQPKIDPCSSELHKDYLKLLESGKDADVTFLVNGEMIMAHKTVLTARSTYFDSMFHSDMKENRSNQVKVVGADTHVFKGMLHFLYGGLPPQNLVEIAIDLYVIADQYDLVKLRDICESSICDNLNPGNVVDTLILAENYGRENMMSLARAYLKANIDAVEKVNENQEKLEKDPNFLFKLVVHLCRD